MAAKTTPRIELRTAPHTHSGLTVEQIMRQVVLALLPVCAFAVYQWGASAVALLAVVTGSCLATEALFSRLAGRSVTLNDWSAAITGLLLALTLPPGFPLWMGAVAGFVAIALGKSLFGGLGLNVFNPALVGRAFVQAAFPAAITSFVAPYATERFTAFIPSSLALPFLQPPSVDMVSAATPLAAQKFDAVLADTTELFLGHTSGSLGETSALLILLCGAYLAIRRLLDWRIPAAVLLGAALTAGAFHAFDAARYPDVPFVLFSGGLMLGAVFMATDPVGSPVTPLAVWIFGLLIGALTVFIRLFGGLTEGVMYAILIGNALAPLIDELTPPRTYGMRRFGGGS
jgi:electron transport complex protein RnfD